MYQRNTRTMFGTATLLCIVFSLLFGCCIPLACGKSSPKRIISGLEGIKRVIKERSFSSFQSSYVEVYVMLQLDVVDNNGNLKYPDKLRGQLEQLKSGGVDGVMTDVWWGLVENQPKQYRWTPYQQLIQMVKEVGLKMQVVMSFHRCGGNVGDTCDIPLPMWVRNVGENNPDIYYTDQHGNRDTEYLSSGVDHEPVFNGRSAIDLYHDFMQSFADTFHQEINDDVIVEIQVGMGPAGELRYPSYQLNLGWSFPGVGEFQCYDSYLAQRLKQAAVNFGHPEWGLGGPSNAGNYNSRPWETGFFGKDGFDNWESDYGRFFLDWYSQTLIDHGDAVLQRARKVFGNKMRLSGKISGIHWWYLSDSHAAELTAGYYNTYPHDGYVSIAKMFDKYNTVFDFTCLEMRDSEQSGDCQCGPAELVRQTEDDAWSVGIDYSGENALPRYDRTAYEQIESQAKRNGKHIESFTYLRLTDTLLSGNNWNLFTQFVANMHNL